MNIRPVVLLIYMMLVRSSICFCAGGAWKKSVLTCGDGKQIQTRNCIFYCEVNLIDEISSPAEPWSEWTALGGCSVTCGEGKQYQKKTRFLHSAHINETVIEETVCNQTKCAENSCVQLSPEQKNVKEPWSEWTALGGCSVTCGEGKQYQKKTRFLHSAHINETVIEETVCNQTKCAENSGVQLSPERKNEPWSEWTALGGCSVTCGEGKQYQKKTRFLHSAHINETVIEEKVCNQTKCAVSKWDHLRNLTFEEKKEMMKEELVELKANLTIDRKNTSAAIRRRTSARDDRTSSSSLGYFAITLLVIPLVLIVCTDCTRWCQSNKNYK